MEKETWFLVALAVCFFLLGFYISNYVDETSDYPSQCYTDLQPSNYFTGSPSPISSADFGNKIIIESNEIIFIDNQVAPTGSMRPTIPDKAQLLMIKPSSPSDISVGDIVSITRQGKKDLLHRIVRIENGYYTTKGDNNNVEDKEKWTYEDINGKVVGILY